ncbi:hypothetical protein TNCV_310951 [Trichonephila clavipes]|nr:hypothetical protein TNCV_310951 [Trichonephila clavipes]
MIRFSIELGRMAKSGSRSTTSVVQCIGTMPTKLHNTSRNQNLIRRRIATAGSDGVQSGRQIFDDFFQHLWQYIGNNTANVVLQMVKRLWLIRIDQ